MPAFIYQNFDVHMLSARLCAESRQRAELPQWPGNKAPVCAMRALGLGAPDKDLTWEQGGQACCPGETDSNVEKATPAQVGVWQGMLSEEGIAYAKLPRQEDMW